jgi:hypothetical protein
MNQPENPPGNAPRSLWPWIMLVLWTAWLAALITLSWNEWGRPRISHDQDQRRPAGEERKRP